MDVKIKKDSIGIMPTRAHIWDAGLDLYAADTKTVPAHGRMVFDLGIHIQLSPNFSGYVKSRSGMMAKNGIITDGTIDPGYTGAIKVVLFNLSNEDYRVNRGDKIAQLVIVQHEIPGLILVDDLDDSERGEDGFGSTGV